MLENVEENNIYYNIIPILEKTREKNIFSIFMLQNVQENYIFKILILKNVE